MCLGYVLELPVSHCVPWKPDAQLQLNPFTPSIQVPLFLQGWLAQSSISVSKENFAITAEIHTRSWVNFYGQYADRHINLKFMRRVSERGREIRQFVIIKNKLMSVFNAPVLLLTMNFVTTLSKWSADPLGCRLVDPQLLWQCDDEIYDQ